MKILIVGGVAAGTKVAAKLKRENRNLDVKIITKGKHISYAGCGLPYYIGHVIKSEDQLIVNTVEQFSNLTGVEVINETEVIKINRDSKTVDAIDLNTNQNLSFDYDKLIIASGASPIKPKLEGIDLDGVHFLRTPEDAIKIKKDIVDSDKKRVVVVGGGFIGLEVAENLSMQGIKVTVIDMAKHVLPGFDDKMCEFVENHLSENNLAVLTNVKMEAILGEQKVEKIKTSRRALKADAVILAMGIRPNTSFLDNSGIELMPNKTIKVDKYLQTNDENIFAIGDCCCVTNRITNARQWSPMGSSANIEGRLLAKNLMSEATTEYKGVLGTGICKLFNLNVGRTGLSESQAIEAGFDVETVVCVVDDKAHYYPNAGSFIIKMIADKNTRKFLGIQVLGKGSVDKIVDIAVTAISLDSTIDQLQNLDFAYAPPFSTAIHPFANAINILINKINNEFETISPEELDDIDLDNYTLIDAAISPSINSIRYINLTDINGDIDGLDKDENILLICSKGKRAYLLQNRMKFYGYKNTKVLEGGTIFNDLDLDED